MKTSALKFCLPTICLGFTGLGLQTTGTESHEKESKAGTRPSVFLTVSSLATKPWGVASATQRQLVLNWYNAVKGLNENEFSWVGLFTYDPRDNVGDPLVSVKPRFYPNGYYRTSVQFPIHTFAAKNLTDDCLGFWIAYANIDIVLASTCLRARPHWMYNMRRVITNASLADLVLPGTHNAGCYAPYKPVDDILIARYRLTQDESIWNQLVYGIRYLDLRVSYQWTLGSSNQFWITHSVFLTEVSVKQVITQVKAFLSATKEIVIMDFHRFVNGFSGRQAASRHRELIVLLEQELEEYMIPVSMTWATLGQLWETDKRLYVGYAANSERRENRYLFPGVKHLWGDVDKVEKLFWYLNNSVCKREHSLTSAMAQLTPTVAGAIFDVYGGLRHMAHVVNQHVTQWFRDFWWQCANIISTDYFLGNNIIDVAVETNKKKSTVYW